MSRGQAAIGSLLLKSSAAFSAAKDLYANSLSLLRQTFKEREGNASQLNRLGFATSANSSARSYQSCFSVIQVRTTSKQHCWFQFRLELRTGN
jgi:hypothetical protein